ncbi:MAG: fibro-slime domain-containing protein [Phycisphaerales bacterium]|nr:fibro-slime domain-containing protein [Phycisphaerales bacterium]
MHTEFTYQSGQTFEFSGDDDVWVFINDQLAIDLGGLHSKASQLVILDSLGLTPGSTYPIDIFFAERATGESTFYLSTDINLAPERSYVYTPDAIDPDGDTLSWSLLKNPVGLTINPSTGRIFWKPAITDVGSHTVKILVSDSRGGYDIEEYVLVVEDPYDSQITGIVYRDHNANSIVECK